MLMVKPAFLFMTGKQVPSSFQTWFYIYSLLQEQIRDQKNTENIFLKMDLVGSKTAGMDHPKH